MASNVRITDALARATDIGRATPLMSPEGSLRLRTPPLLRCVARPTAVTEPMVGLARDGLEAARLAFGGGASAREQLDEGGG